MSIPETEALRRWRLVLGEGDAPLPDDLDARRDSALTALYPPPPTSGQRSSESPSAAGLAQELVDLPQLFPHSIQEVLQQDALERIGLRRLLNDSTLIEAIAPDAGLAADLLRLRPLLPAKLLENARRLIERIAAELEQRIAEPLGQAVRGSLTRSPRTRRPRHDEIDWPATIRANLRHYQARYRTIVPATRLGCRRQGGVRREFVICMDQSGSMAESLVHAGIMAGVLSRMRGLRTTLLAFDTRVVDLTEHLHDPVELLMSLRPGGGTDIAGALAQARKLIREPEVTTVCLLSDLIEGGPRDRLWREVAALQGTGARLVSLLSLNDRGAPVHDQETARGFEARGIPVLACGVEELTEILGREIVAR